jgi:hypothetical protein
MSPRRSTPIALLIALLVVATGFMVRTQGVSAQEADSHPAHIHSGSCTTLGDVVYPLNNVGSSMETMGTPVASMMMGATTAIPVEMSSTTVDTTLADLTSEAYAINVHESAANIGNYIACGDIGGNMMGSDLAIGIAALNDSGFSGVAWLHDNGDGTTTVTVFLTHSGGM